MEHELKTWPEFFKHILSGEKPFEIRKDDRGFRAGDKLKLREWSRKNGYTGREIVVDVSYVLSGWGLKDGYIAMGIRKQGV